MSEPTEPVPTADLEQLREVFEQVPFEFFRTNRCLPVEVNDAGALVLGVMEDQFDRQVLDIVRQRVDRPLETVPLDEEDLEASLNRMEGEVVAGRTDGFETLSEQTLDSFRRQVVDARQKLDSSDRQPIAGRVDSILADAVLKRASDVHFEPREDHVRVRLRRNGMLFDYDRLPREVLPGLISRIKVMADLDIAEQLRPQDGRINLTVGNREIDVRVSVVPTVHGERAVLRILDRDTLKQSLPDLGLNERDLERVESLLSRSDGIVLVTGPTGSGKTTSLYCFLQQIQNEQSNIITLEDPVEYQLPGINQVEINPDRDLTFARGLRSVLRQDPDVILVGEIRDAESAELAVHASLTGHLVFSTLHTRRSTGALSRLLNLGLDPHLIGAGLSGILAQRLVRTLCEACREEGGEIYRATGCEQCDGTGYEGRTGIFEILTVDEEIRGHLEAGSGEPVLEKHLQGRDFRSLEQAGEKLVRRGVTSRDELHRVLNR